MRRVKLNFPSINFREQYSQSDKYGIWMNFMWPIVVCFEINQMDLYNWIIVNLLLSFSDDARKNVSNILK